MFDREDVKAYITDLDENTKKEMARIEEHTKAISNIVFSKITDEQKLSEINDLVSGYQKHKGPYTEKTYSTDGVSFDEAVIMLQFINYLIQCVTSKQSHHEELLKSITYIMENYTTAKKKIERISKNNVIQYYK